MRAYISLKQGRRTALTQMMKIIVPMLMLISMVQPAGAIEYTAEAAIIIDSETGKILDGKNYNARLGMASTTKIMTGILAIEMTNMTDVVTIGKNPTLTEGSSIYLTEGEQVTVETLIHGLLLKSGNDTAVALAEHISGNEKEFVKLMNKKAAELGLENTRFENPHGLYAENHYTTAYELAMLARYAMKNETFERIVNKPKYIEDPIGDRDIHYINNANKLISMYEEADGIKPGFTPETGRTLVGSATKDGWRVITVTLNCAEDWNEHKRMFDYAFGNWKLEKVAKKGESIGTVRVRGGKYNETGAVLNEDVCVPVKITNKEKSTIAMDKTVLKAPVYAGDKVAVAKVTTPGGEVFEIDVTANTTVEKKGYNIFKLMWDFVLALFG